MGRRHRKVGWLAGGALLVIALALLFARRARDERTAGPSAATPVGVGAGSAATTRRAEVDPRSLPRGSIAGIVREVAGPPVAGARVCADADGLPVELTREPACATTSAEGMYVIPGLLAARYEVTAGARAFRPATYHPAAGAPAAVVLAAGEARTGVDLALGPGGVEVTGVVSDISGGPIAHALVRASVGRWDGEHTTPAVETAADGTFVLWSDPGSVRVTARADGYASGAAGGRAPGVVSLALTPEGSFAGTVVEAASGAPVEGARVEVDAAEPDGRDGGWTRTDARGAFRVDRLMPGRYQVTARTDRGHGQSAGSTLVGLGEHVVGVRVMVIPAARIEGRVEVVRAGARMGCPQATVALVDHAAGTTLQTHTAPDGTVTATGALPGTYVPALACPGYRPAETYPPITITDQDVLGLVWEVHPGATIRGRVQAHDGAPVSDAQVVVRPATTAGATRGWGGATSAPDGTYEVTGLDAGSYTIRVSSDRGPAPAAGVTVGAGATVTRDLTLEAGGAIAGTVVDTRGTPVAGGSVLVRALDGPGRGEATTDGRGAFTVPGLPAGRYRVVMASLDDVPRAPGTPGGDDGARAQVTVGATATVRLVVEAATATITGVVVDAEGRPVADAFVSRAREGADGGAVWSWGSADRAILTATDGTFTLTGLAVGAYTIRALRRGGGEARALHVATGTSARLTLLPTGSIAGTVTLEGAPSEVFQIVLTDPSTGFARREAFTRTGGRFQIDDLPAGTFQLLATMAGGKAVVEIALSAGEAKANVAVALEALGTLTGRVIDLVTRQPVPGMAVFARLAHGGTGELQVSGAGHDHITDAAGRFTVRNAPRGDVMVRISAVGGGAPYGSLRIVRQVAGAGVFDLGDVPVVRRRTDPGEPVGELGATFVAQPAGTPVGQLRTEVGALTPGGPAASAGLVVGDLVISVDGIDVTGASAVYARALLAGRPGARLTLGLARGASIVVTLAPPT